MATDATRLQGEIVEKPEAQELDVERLVAGFLRSLLAEQKLFSSGSELTEAETTAGGRS
jgi:hypothetical protein